MVVLDGWQYVWHRYMHHNRFLYRHINSWHHHLVVPYAFGSQYNHPIEGLLLDTLGGALAFVVSGMSPRASIFFFSLCTIKGVDDHCGLWLPGNVFHLCFWNNTAYHDVHHQLHGSRFNFSQPFNTGNAYFAEGLRLYRGPNIGHSAKRLFAEGQTKEPSANNGPRQRGLCRGYDPR